MPGKNEKIKDESNKNTTTETATQVPSETPQPNSGEQISQNMNSRIELDEIFDNMFECFDKIKGDTNTMKLLDSWGGKNEISKLFDKFVKELKETIESSEEYEYDEAQAMLDQEAEEEAGKTTTNTEKAATSEEDDDDDEYDYEYDDDQMPTEFSGDNDGFGPLGNIGNLDDDLDDDLSDKNVDQLKIDIQNELNRRASKITEKKFIENKKAQIQEQTAHAVAKEQEARLMIQENESVNTMFKSFGEYAEEERIQKEKEKEKEEEHKKSAQTILEAGAGFSEDQASREEESGQTILEAGAGFFEDQASREEEERREEEEEEEEERERERALEARERAREERKKAKEKKRADKAEEEIENKRKEEAIAEEFPVFKAFKDLIEPLTNESLYLQLSGFSKNNKQTTDVKRSLREFVKKLISLYNFWASSKEERPDLTSGTLDELSGDKEDKKSGSTFEELVSVGPDISFIEYKIGQAKQLNDFFKDEDGYLEVSWNNFVKAIEERNQAERETRKELRSLIPPSQEAQDNDSIIAKFKSNEEFREFEKDAFMPAKIINPSSKSIDIVEQKITGIQKIISKHGKDKTQAGYISNLDSGIKLALGKLKQGKVEYPSDTMEKMHIALVNEYGGKDKNGNIKMDKDIIANSVNITDDIRRENVFPLKNANGFIRAIEYAITSVLSRIPSGQKGGSSSLPLFDIIVNSPAKESLQEIIKDLLGYLHSTEDEKKFNFLNTLYINGLVTDIEDEAASEEMFNEMTVEKVLELQEKLRNLRRHNKLMEKSDMFELNELSQKLNAYAGKDIDLGDKMVGVDSDKQVGEELIKNKERDAKDDEGEFSPNAFKIARLIAHVCGAVAKGLSGQDGANKFTGFLYNDNTNLQKTIKKLDTATINREAPTQKGAIRELARYLKSFAKELKARVPTNPVGRSDDQDNADSLVKEINNYAGNMYGKKLDSDLEDLIKDDLLKGEATLWKLYLGEDEEFIQSSPKISLNLPLPGNG